MTCLFGSCISLYQFFLWFELYFVLIFYDLILLPYTFHLTTINHHYLLLFLYHFFYTFLCLYQPFSYSVFHWSFRFFISFFILLYSLNTLLTETNSSRQIYEPIKAWQTRNSIVFNWSFSNNTIVSCFFLFFYIVYVNFSILSVIALMFIFTAEIVISIGT